VLVKKNHTFTVRVTFKNTKLGCIANDDKKLFSEFSTIRARVFKQRLDDMTAAISLEDLKYAPGYYHELNGDRKGHFACDLDLPFKLIFIPDRKDLFDNGEIALGDWSDINGIEILEISDSLFA
jgi:toxin HigB-1